MDVYGCDALGGGGRLPGAAYWGAIWGQGEGVIDTHRAAGTDGTDGRARDARFRVLVDAVDHDAAVERVLAPVRERRAFCLTALGDAGERSRELWAGKHKGCR
jgi:hypothetical protein